MMKKKFIGTLLVCVMAGSLLVGCNGKKSDEGEVKTAGEITSTAESAYQFDEVNPEDVTIGYKGKDYKLSELPEGVEYDIVSPVYSSDILTVSVEGEEYSVKMDNYVPASGTSWVYGGKEVLPKGTKSGDLDIKKLKGMISYEDGTSKEAVVEYATVNIVDGVAYVTITDGLNTFSWETTVEGAKVNKDKDKSAKGTSDGEEVDVPDETTEEAVEEKGNDAKSANDAEDASETPEGNAETEEGDGAEEPENKDSNK